MFITTQRHARELAALRMEHALDLDTARSRCHELARDLDSAARRAAALAAERDDARGDLLVWRETAVEALRSIADLQRRYAPPAPIEGDVAQPPSVERADALTVADARNPEEVGG